MVWLRFIPRAVDRRIARRVLSSIGEGVVICDADLRIEYANAAVASLMQLDAGRIEGHDAMAFVHPADRATVHREFTKVATRLDGAARAAFRAIGAGGQSRRVEAVAVNRFGDRAIGGVMVTFRDITEQWMAEEALREREALHRELVEQSADAIFTASAEGWIRHVNPAACDLTGYDESELCRMQTHQLYAVRERPLVRASLEALSRGEPLHVQRTLKRKNGTELRVDVLSRRLHDGRLMASIRDVSAYNARAQRAARVERLEALGALAGGIGHDFNNLLTVITSSAEAIAPTLDPASEGAAAIEDLRAAANSGAELVRRLVRGTRGDAIAVAPLCVSQMIRAIERPARRLLRTGITLTIDIEPDLPPVLADHVAMEECLLNVITNARDAMAGSGTLEISVVRANDVQAGGSHSMVAATGEFVAIAVTDTGTGMDDATLRRAAEPYFTTKPEGLGTGLGLAAVYRLMQEQRGFMTIQSTAGVGTSVILYLSAARNIG